MYVRISLYNPFLFGLMDMRIFVSTTVVRMDDFMYGCMHVQLFVSMDGYMGECMHVLGLTRGRLMLKWISIC